MKNSSNSISNQKTAATDLLMNKQYKLEEMKD
jgi:hypothetical protein